MMYKLATLYCRTLPVWLTRCILLLLPPAVIAIQSVGADNEKQKYTCHSTIKQKLTHNIHHVFSPLLQFTFDVPTFLYATRVGTIRHLGGPVAGAVGRAADSEASAPPGGGGGWGPRVVRQQRLTSPLDVQSTFAFDASVAAVVRCYWSNEGDEFRLMSNVGVSLFSAVVVVVVVIAVSCRKFDCRRWKRPGLSICLLGLRLVWCKLCTLMVAHGFSRCDFFFFLVSFFFYMVDM